MNGRRPILEVIAISLSDAIEAERGGADRLEIISNFEQGGLTPPFGLVQDILAAVRLPVRVMLRESEDYTVSDGGEIEKLCTAARQFATLRVDGLVLGFLRDKEVDLDLTERVLSCAPRLKATFHHAFDETEDPIRSIRKLKSIGQIDRILTSGGSGNWPQKIERLKSYEPEARPEIAILAGGGLNAKVIRTICEESGVREFHVGRAARFPAHTDGKVNARLVKELARVIDAGLEA